MEETIITPDQPEVAKRPTFLTVLCILTYIFSGFVIIWLFLILGFGDVIISKISEMSAMDPDADTEQMDKAVMYMENKTALLISLVLVIASLVGAIMMWNLKRMGYYIYTAVNVIAFILPIAIFGQDFSFFGLFMTLLFIILYGLNLKYMRR